MWTIIYRSFSGKGILTVQVVIMYMAVWYRLSTYRFIHADMNQKAPSISTGLLTFITKENYTTTRE
jgi:hypothetical protein